MSGGFDPLSLVIDLNADFFPFHPIYVLIPAAFDRPILRVFIHELLHFWQTLGSGFLMNMALQEWDAMQAIENGSGVPGDLSNNRLVLHFNELPSEAGFSPWNLHEALCRYWDIHILGPHNLLRQSAVLPPARETVGKFLAITRGLARQLENKSLPERGREPMQIPTDELPKTLLQLTERSLNDVVFLKDLALRLTLIQGVLYSLASPARAGTTPRPPEWMLEDLEPDEAECARTYKPTGYTNELFDALMQLEDSYAEPYRLMLKRFDSKTTVTLFPLIGYFSFQTRKPVRFFTNMIQLLSPKFTLGENRERSIHELWRLVFSHVRKACYESSARLTGSYITPGFVTMIAGLRNHPLYTHFASLPVLEPKRWDAQSDFCFALPGDPESRQLLAESVLPPVVQFRDGRWTPTSTLHKLLFRSKNGDKITGKSASEGPAVVIQDPEQLVKDALDLHSRVQAYREADLIARLSKSRAHSLTAGAAGAVPGVEKHK